MLETIPLISEARKHESKLQKQPQETANSYLLVYYQTLWETIQNSKQNDVTYTTHNKSNCPGEGGIFISIT